MNKDLIELNYCLWSNGKANYEFLVYKNAYSTACGKNWKIVKLDELIYCPNCGKKIVIAK